jgi:hypothetical protein
LTKLHISAALEKARIKRAERVELTADWVVDERCGDVKFCQVLVADLFFDRVRRRGVRLLQGTPVGGPNDDLPFAPRADHRAVAPLSWGRRPLRRARRAPSRGLMDRAPRPKHAVELRLDRDYPGTRCVPPSSLSRSRIPTGSRIRKTCQTPRLGHDQGI